MSEKKPPFYPNRDDAMSCMLSCYKMAVEALVGEVLTWEELEDMSGYQPGRAAWSIKMWTELLGQGFDIKMIEPFDYGKYAQEGEGYLHTVLNPEELKWQLANSNLLDIKPLIPEFLAKVSQEVRSPQLADIDTMLEEGYLVLAQLNHNALNTTPGYEAHMVLIYERSEDGYIMHDPGPPAREGRVVSADVLLTALGGTANSTEVTGLRYREDG